MTIRYSHSKRRRHLDVWQQNGLPKKHYCHLHDLNIATFYYWLKHHQDDVVNVPSAFIPARQVVPENNGSDAVTLDLPNGCSVSCLPVELQARDAGLFPMLTP